MRTPRLPASDASTRKATQRRKDRFDAAHAQAKQAMREGDYAAVADAALKEREVIREQTAVVKDAKRRMSPKATKLKTKRVR